MSLNSNGLYENALAEMIQYSEDVLTGKIVACKKHQWACLRFLKDLERTDWRWSFDESKANFYFTFMTLCKHRKGPLAGQQKIPCGYELFVYGNIYGFWDKETNTRRFRRMYEQLARKQAKSQDKAIQALFESSLFGEQSAEVYVAATKKEQTRFVWGEAKWIYENSDYLKDRFTCKFDAELLQKVIKHIKSDSFFSRLSKDDGKKGDGANPHFGILDEYHLHETTEYYDLFTSGMKTRANPLLSIITTAGFDLNNPCYRVEYDYVSKILNPDNPVENDRYFAIVCEVDQNDTGETITLDDGRKIEAGGLIDDIGSDTAILKSNPVTGYSEMVIENIRIEVDEAKDKPEKMRDVLTKTFNIWVNQRSSGYMNLGKWAACSATSERPMPDLFKKNVFVGVDLSSTIDLTSVAFVIPLVDGEYAILGHSFIPEEKYSLKIKTDNVPYDLWKKQGWITITDGAEVDYHIVLEYIENQYIKYNWPRGEFCFDRALATWLKQEAEKRSFTPIDVPQTFSTLSEPCKNLRSKAYNKKIIHNNNPVITWAMGNAVTRTGPSENIILDKGKSSERIDPVAAIINAMSRAMTNEGKPKKTGKVVFI